MMKYCGPESSVCQDFFGCNQQAKLSKIGRIGKTQWLKGKHHMVMT